MSRLINKLTPNPRLQRTRLRSPLSRKPFGHRRYIAAALLLWATVFSPSLAVPTQPATPTPTAALRSPDAKQARRIAEAAFLKFTGRKIKTYSIKQLPLSSTGWEFLVKGTKRFARPGYYWVVSVDMNFGTAVVTAGSDEANARLALSVA